MIGASFKAPEFVRNDNGPPFASMEFQGFLEYLGIEHKAGGPHWPQSNGEAERCNETMLKVASYWDITCEIVDGERVAR